MGNLVTWLIAVPIVAAGIYILVKNLRGQVTGDGWVGCTGCSPEEEKTCDDKSKYD